MGFGNLFRDLGTSLGQKIGAGYAEQGKSWGEVSSMPSSGSGMMSDSIRSGVKTGYDNYMTNNQPVSVSTSSANMIQSPGGSEGGLAASADGIAGLANRVKQSQSQGGNRLAGQYASNTGGSNWFGSFGNSSHQSMPNGLAASMYSRGNRFDVNQTIQAPGQYNVIDGAQLI